jgi:hypothetical protein
MEQFNRKERRAAKPQTNELNDLQGSNGLHEAEEFARATHHLTTPPK